MENKRKEEKMEKNTNYSLTIGFPELLTLVFIVLKLCHVITWSWLWVLAPMWIGLGLAATMFIIAFLIKVFHE